MAQFHFTELHIFAIKIKAIFCENYLVFIVHFISHCPFYFISTNKNTPQFSLLVFQEAKKNHPKVYCTVQTV